MHIHVDMTGTLEHFQILLQKVVDDPDAKGVLVLACDANEFTPEGIDDMLKNTPLPLFGGIFPAIVHNREVLHRGTIIAGLATQPEVKVLEGISDDTLHFDRALEKLIPETTDKTTMFILVDGYSKRISSLIDSLYILSGLQYNYIGGGAGSINPSALDMRTTPCLFSNKGLLADCAVFAMVDLISGIGVSHGWHKISGPYKVTETDGNAIKSLDWQPAFSVYREIIREQSGETITEDNFFDIAKRFPFGMSNLGPEIIVRDPYSVDNESLIIATEIPQESFIDILTGDLETMVNAAKTSYRMASDSFAGGKIEAIFLIDCISRALFFADDFSREIKAVNKDGVPLIGFLSLGEIANYGQSFMELYNKTCVVAALGPNDF